MNDEFKTSPVSAKCSPSLAGVMPMESLTGHSPVVAEKPFNFKVALDKMIEGKKIQKLEWKEKGCADHYGYINKTTAQVYINREGKDHQWILSEGDILGEDYVIVK